MDNVTLQGLVDQIGYEFNFPLISQTNYFSNLRFLKVKLYRVEVERNDLHDKVLKLTSVYDRMNEVRVENEDLKKKNTDLVRRVFYFIYTSQKYQISRYSQRILFVFLILGGESGKFETTDYSSS